MNTDFMSDKITIAVDGFSSSGKSTMAKKLAKRLGYVYVDTGAMYRAMTLYCLDNGLIDGDSVNTSELERRLDDIHISFQLNSSTGKSETCLNGKNVETEIRGMRVSEKVSIVAAIPAVRHSLVALQQAMGKEKGIVMDGRDIGTVVFPDAEMKIYVDAPAETRARRRFDELRAKGDNSTTYEEVLKNVKERDYIDQTRKESPLRKADDAIVLDNSNMSIEEQDAWLIDVFNKIVNK